MFFRSSRGQKAPHLLLLPDADGPIRLNEARLSAWALALGEGRSSSDLPGRRRVHRGTLPDVDFSRAVAAPRRPGLFARLFRLIARRRDKAAPSHGAAESGGDHGVLGEAERKPYLTVATRDSNATRPAMPAGMKHRSRAA